MRSFLRYADDTKPIRTREWMHDPISSHDFSINAYSHHVFSSYRPVLPHLQQNWNLEVLVFKERGKPEYPEKNLSGRGREPTTNSTHMWRPRQHSNRSRIGGRRVLSPLRHQTKNTKLLRITCTPHWIVPELAMYLKYLTTHAVEWPAAEFGGTNLFYSRGKTSPLDIVWRNQLRPLFRCTWRLSRLPPIQCPVKRRKNERYHHSFHSPKTNTQSASSLILNENISNEDDVKCGNTNLKEHMIVAVVIAI